MYFFLFLKQRKYIKPLPKKKAKARKAKKEISEQVKMLQEKKSHMHRYGEKSEQVIKFVRVTKK